MGHRVQWNMSRNGRATSKCGKFMILPLKRHGNDVLKRGRSYSLYRCNDDGSFTIVSRRSETQAEAKEDAEWQAAFEAGELEFSRAPSDGD